MLLCERRWFRRGCFNMTFKYQFGRLPVFALTSVALALSGCSSTSFDDLKSTLDGNNSINYKSVGRTDPLSVPPDLTQATGDPRFKAPAGTATYSQYAQQTKADGAAVTSSAQAAVLPQYKDVRVERDGDLRWLSTSIPPDQLYSRVADFFTENGFNLEKADPKAGLMTTNWAENRAKIPQDALRQLLGNVLDSLYDSGTRDKFSARIERAGNRSEVYISHQHMVEEHVAASVDSTIVWKNGREDPGLNAAMIARLMVFLGEDVDVASKKMAQASVNPQSPAVTMPAGDKTSLVVADSFERAWRRVGVALDSGGFTVDDRDRAAGDFFVRYVDSDTGVKREDPGFFERLFGAKALGQAPSYKLHLSQTGSKTEITVFDANGQRDKSATVQRMLAVLADKI